MHNDTDLRVKTSLINSFPEIAKLLGQEYTIEYLMPLFDEIIQRRNEPKLENVINDMIPQFLKCLNDENLKIKYFNELSLDYVVNRNFFVDLNWRKRFDLAERYNNYSNVFSDEITYNRLVPLIVRLVCFEKVIILCLYFRLMLLGKLPVIL